MADEDPLRTSRDVNLPVTVELSASGFEDAEEIARGVFGVVYRCTQAALDRTVAVKVLTAELDEDNQRRFFREQRAMGRLTGHPNIICSPAPAAAGSPVAARSGSGPPITAPRVCGTCSVPWIQRPVRSTTAFEIASAGPITYRT